MNMNKKGFTLIELLAVIVILAIIAVIATPIITGIIEDAKKNSAADSAYGALNAVQSYYTSTQLKESPETLPLTVEWSENGPNKAVIMSGTPPTSGSITLKNDGTYEVEGLVVNGYSCTYASQKFSCN